MSGEGQPERSSLLHRRRSWLERPAASLTVGLAHAGSEGDRLQQLRAVLPCEVRVVAESHPLFGRLLPAKGFKRLNGLLQLTVLLPDGSPGTIRADATDVLGVVARSGPAVVLDAAGLRELHRLVTGLREARRVRLRAGRRK